jgi:biotin-dependent carboxylase-like uncharacterized protein
MTLVGPELQTSSNTQIAITGGAILPRIDGENVPMWQTVNIQEGDTLSFGKMESGCRSYLAIRGGINTSPMLGSRSTYLPGGVGGINGRQLMAGDTIEGFNTERLEFEYKMPGKLVPQFTNHFKAHAILGPQDDMFTEKGIDTFFSNQYKVTLETDRMGYRLEGPLIEHKGKADIVSDALLPGAVQVPKNGKPIVIMRDAQTTGGYPKIAVIISSDLSMLGQAKPNDVIEFHEVTVTKAHEKLREYSKLLQNLDNMLVKANKKL